MKLFQGFTYVAPSLLEEMHKPQVVKARSPRKGMFQIHHNSTPFGLRSSQPQLATAQPNGLGSRTTGFCLNSSPQYPPQEIDNEDMMDTSSSAAPSGPSRYYGSNYPLPPHL